MIDQAKALWALAGLLVSITIAISILVFVIYSILRDFAFVSGYLTAIFVGGS